MKSQEPSLEYLLPLLSHNTPTRILQSEIQSIRKVIEDILQEINKRKRLGVILLSDLEDRIMHLHSDLMNVDNVYLIGTPLGLANLKQSLEIVENQKVHSQENTSKDIIELKKLLWHYWLILKEKESMFNLLK